MKVTVPTNIKKVALEHAKNTKWYKYTRVSKSFTDEAEAYMLAWIRNRVNKQPSKGKTIR